MSKVHLHPKFKAFADNYLVSGNASQSARDAGYSPASAGVTGSKLLKRPDIQVYLQAQAAKLTETTEDLQTKVLRELDTMAFTSIANFIRIDADGLPQVDFSNATEEQLRAIASVATKRRTATDKDGKTVVDEEAKFTMADKYRGLEMLGRHVGLFKADEQRVVVDVADRLLHARARMLRIQNGATE